MSGIKTCDQIAGVQHQRDHYRVDSEALSHYVFLMSHLL